jgi:hypothetical protein
MSENRDLCEPFRDDLAELALGVVTGLERAQILEHVEGCPQCSAELEQLAAAADSVLAIVPGVDPPAGFEVRVLDRIKLERRTARPVVRLRRVLASAAIVLASVGAGIGIGLASSSSTPQSTLSAALRWAPLDSAGTPHGTVVLSAGHPAWFVMIVDHLAHTSAVRCAVVTNDGRTINMGEFWLTHGSGAWSTTLPVAVSNVRIATLTSLSGKVLASASLQA